MKLKFLLSLIIILAFVFRIWKVDLYPGSLYGDEQSFAWNAYNIMMTGQDEYGTPYPLQFRAFDDYKAPIPVYLLVPFFKLLGMNPFAIRLPVVLFSTASVFLIYLLSRNFFGRKASLLSAFFLSVSSWHIHLSRGYFESTIQVFFLLLGLFFLMKRKTSFLDLILGFLSFIACLYSYFTSRIFLLGMIPLILLYHRQFLKFEFKKYLVSIAVLIIFSLPLMSLTFFGSGGSRMSKLMGAVIKDTERQVAATRFFLRYTPDIGKLAVNKFTIYPKIVMTNYLEHLSANFLFITGDTSLRYFTGERGLEHIFILPFFLIGTYYIFKTKNKKSYFLLAFLFLMPIPASLVGRPFAVRSLSMLPFIIAISGYGAFEFFRNIPYKIFFKGLVSFVVFFLVGIWLFDYYFVYPTKAATWWGWENKTAVDLVRKNKDLYQYIFVSDFYTGSTLAYAVYNEIDPVVYRNALANPVILADGRKLIKIDNVYFGSLDIDAARMSQSIIPPSSFYIGRPEELKSSETINAPDDNRLIFNIYRK